MTEPAFHPTMLPDFMPRKVCVDANGCWLWSGAKTNGGYGIKQCRRPDGTRYNTTAHRASWMALVGPIAPGLELDHLCRVRACINPAHLEPVTPLENQIRAGGLVASQLARTHCPQGHEYSEENTYPSRKKNGGRHRVCKTCWRAKVQKRKRNRALQAAKVAAR